MHDIGHQFLDFRDSLGIAGAALAGICQLLLVTLLRRAADISVILQGIPQQIEPEAKTSAPDDAMQ